MAKKKLKEIGEKLDISEKDIKDIKKNHFKLFLIGFLYLILGILFLYLGVSYGIDAKDSSKYPYSSLIFMVNKNSQSK